MLNLMFHIKGYDIKLNISFLIWWTKNVVNMKSYQFSEFVLFALKFALKWFLHNRIPGRLEHHFILMPIKLRKCFFRRLFFRLFFFFFDFRLFFLLLPVLINIDKKDHIYLKFCYNVKLILMYNYPGNRSKTS